MKWVTSLIVIIATTLSASARIGDTISGMEARYGTSFESGFDEFEPTLEVVGFDKEAVTGLRQRGFELYAVKGEDGRCRQMSYVKGWGKVISGEEIRGMLTANTGALAWKTGFLKDGSSVYVRSDGAIARAVGRNQLDVMTPDRAEALGLVLADS